MMCKYSSSMEGTLQNTSNTIGCTILMLQEVTGMLSLNYHTYKIH